MRILINFTDNCLTNVLTRLTLAATGIDLLARRGISLADIRPTKVSVSRTSKWLMLQALETFFGFMTYLLSSCLASWAKHESHHDGPQSNRNRLDSVISQATESVAVHDVLQVLVKCFAEIATRTSAAKLLPGQYTVLVSGDESQQWWHNRVILDGRCHD